MVTSNDPSARVCSETAGSDFLCATKNYTTGYKIQTASRLLCFPGEIRLCTDRKGCRGIELTSRTSECKKNRKVDQLISLLAFHLTHLRQFM